MGTDDGGVWVRSSGYQKGLEMPRRKSKSDISLFPFMSVLSSVIGVLQLFIVAVLSTRALELETRYQRPEVEHKPQAGTTGADEKGIDVATYAALEADLKRLEPLLEESMRERDELRRHYEALEDALEYKKTQSLASSRQIPPREFAKPLAVSVVPDADPHSVQLKPILVEVTSKGYIFHSGRNKFFPAITMKTSTQAKVEFEASSELKAMLNEVQRIKHREYLLFLIRENGVSSFDAIHSYVGQFHKQIRVGWEPFSQEWILAPEND